MNDLVVFIAGCVATWMITTLLFKASGPYQMIAKFRDFMGVKYDDKSNRYGTNVFGELLSCFLCTSVWMGFLVALLVKTDRPTLYTFAFSGAAVLIQTLLERR